MLNNNFFTLSENICSSEIKRKGGHLDPLALFPVPGLPEIKCFSRNEK